MWTSVSTDLFVMELDIYFYFWLTQRKQWFKANNATENNLHVFVCWIESCWTNYGDNGTFFKLSAMKVSLIFWLTGTPTSVDLIDLFDRSYQSYFFYLMTFNYSKLSWSHTTFSFLVDTWSIGIINVFRKLLIFLSSVFY